MAGGVTEQTQQVLKNLRAVLKGLLKDHLRADERALATVVFPGSLAVKPMAGLLA